MRTTYFLSYINNASFMLAVAVSSEITPFLKHWGWFTLFTYAFSWVITEEAIWPTKTK